MAERLEKKLAPGEPRYIPKVFRKAQGKGSRASWGVYDQVRAAWPGYVNGKRVTQDLTEAQAEKVAQELNQAEEMAKRQ